MARDCDAVCRRCRREGMKLLLKGERCFSAKCAFERRQYPPGQHGQNRRFKISNYGLQLREKQKIRRIYQVQETQFRNAYKQAARERGITGENLMLKMECRLDNIVYRLGMAPSLRSARQLVTHGHFEVNGRTVNIPSYQVKPGDVVRVRDNSRLRKAAESVVHNAMRHAREERTVPYLALVKPKMEGTLSGPIKRADIPVAANEQLVVELYSK